MTFGEKMKEAHKKAGMTQEQLASVLTVSRQAVTKWKSDKGIPDIENLKLIAKVLDVSIDYLLDEEGSLDLSCTREPINLEDYEDRTTNKHICLLARIVESFFRLLENGAVLLAKNKKSANKC